ncbi:hypothetical protein [Ferrovum sp.]|uniref:hypothetical protein n=1 Tax=Ferrovum sp. TaxID=2609467 RepID=UPI002635DEA2|nr:hypothetical protein [Ferrovum sp.]
MNAEIQNHTCAAYGCQFPGSLSSSTNGADTWFCRNHFGVFGPDHDPITERIRRYSWMIQIANYLNGDTQHRFDYIRDRADARFRQEGMPDLVMDRTKPLQVWIQRIFAEFDWLVGPKQPQAISSPEANENAERLQELIRTGSRKADPRQWARDILAAGPGSGSYGYDLACQALEIDPKSHKADGMAV